MVTKREERNFSGPAMPPEQAKFLTRMLTRDTFAAANLLVVHQQFVKSDTNNAHGYGKKNTQNECITIRHKS